MSAATWSLSCSRPSPPSFAIAPILVRSLRVGMIEVLDADFIAVARAKGLGRDHGCCSATWPATPCCRPSPCLASTSPYLIGSTVIVEQVFNLNGLGSLLLSSILNRDFPVVQATTLVLGTGVVLVTLATDLLAARLDPRIRLR